ncbi:MAG: corrinoid protein [candidate division WOR-3 bacterium]
MDAMERVAQGVREGNPDLVRSSVEELIKNGANVQEIFDKGLFAGMKVVGELFKEDEIFMPEVLMAAKAMQAGVDVLEPLLVGVERKRTRGKIILGTVKGDLHDLGKNLVALMLKGAGYEVIDLGVNVSAESFVDAAKRENADIVGMSALLTTTMHQMGTVIAALQKAGLSDVKTIIGGCVVDQEFADRIGADGYAENAGAAVDKVELLLKSSDGRSR